MRVSIVVPNYNGEDILEKNFSSILHALDTVQKDISIEVIYVDDGSTDQSTTLLKKLISLQTSSVPIDIIKHERNKGFSVAVNSGVKKATGEIVVLLNTDVRPKKDFLEPLLAHFRDENVFAVGCLDESMENDNTVKRGRGIGRWERGFLVHSAGRLDKDNTLWVSGGSGAFRKKLWDELGGMSELYAPYYWEDIDLSYRALKVGYRLVFEPKSVVIHEHEKGAVKSSASTEKINEIAYRNQFFFVWLNISDPIYLLQHICWLPYHILRTKRSGDAAFLKGFRMARKALPHVLTQRKKSKRLFILSDRKVLYTYNR